MTFEVQTGLKCSHLKPNANDIFLIFSLAFEQTAFNCPISLTKQPLA